MIGIAIHQMHFDLGIEAFFPAPAGMTLSGIALKEYAGIIAYRLKGYL
jgi:hypothetical protein